METRSNSQPGGIPAQYGKSCTNCARAKSRCIYRGDRHECDRCHRLERECIPSVSVRRKTGRRAVASRAAELEQKIEDSVTLLRKQSARESNGDDAVLDTIATYIPAHRRTSSLNESHSDEYLTSVEDGTSDRGGFMPTPSDTLTLGDDLFPTSMDFDLPSMLTSPFEPTASKAEECLSTFRKRMLKYLPFMYLPQELTAGRLREQSPFLWFSIMAVTTKAERDEFALTDAIRRFVAEEMVVDNKKNLDLLLGLLVYIGWFHYHLKQKSNISVMCSLATSLVFDLRLNKSSNEQANVNLPCGNNRGSPGSPRGGRTMTERRVVLACFLLTSQMAYVKKRVDALEWTSHMDECLQVLTKFPEWPGDEHLAAQVRIELIVDQLTRGSLKAPDQTSASYFRVLQLQVERAKEQLPPSLLHEGSIGSQLLYTELVLQDTTISKSPSSLYNPDYQRHQLLELHLTTIISWFDLFFAISPELFVNVPFARWCHAAHGLVLLQRLYILEDPAWDSRAARSRIDLFALCDRAAEILEDSEARRGSVGAPRSEEGMFIRLAHIIKSMRRAWEADLKATDRREAVDYTRQQPGQWAAPNPDWGTGLESGLSRKVKAATATAPPQLLKVPENAWLMDIFNASW